MHVHDTVILLSSLNCWKSVDMARSSIKMSDRRAVYNYVIRLLCDLFINAERCSVWKPYHTVWGPLKANYVKYRYMYIWPKSLWPGADPGILVRGAWILFQRHGVSGSP